MSKDIDAVPAAAPPTEKLQPSPDADAANAVPSIAETRLERRQQQARDGMKARAEHEERESAVRANTIRLRALRLAKEQADADAKALAKPPVRKKPRATSTR